MRHLKAGRKLGRNATHRLALYRNLSAALIRHDRIITTLEKAKAVRPFVEKLITLAKKGTLHARRLALARLGPAANAEVKPSGDDADHRTILAKLFADLGPRFADRAGGYTRIIKRHQRRLGDAGHTAYLELLKEGEVKVKAKKDAPAPRVEDEEQQTQEQETHETEQQTEQQAEQQHPPEGATESKPGDESKPEGEKK